MKFINEKRKMRNEAIHDALVELATIKSFRLKDTSIEGFQAVFYTKSLSGIADLCTSKWIKR